MRAAYALAQARAENPDGQTLFVQFSEEESGEGQMGLMDVLLGQCVLDDALGVEGSLVVLGRGSGGECPPHLWRSQKMQGLIAELRRRFDSIIFHVAPVELADDALNLAPIADGSICVIRADGTRREVVQRAIDMINETHGSVLGAVLIDRTQHIPNVVYRRI